MHLYHLSIAGFRKHLQTELMLSDSTFLIGENNVGKSSILKAIEYLLTQKTIPASEFYSIQDGECTVPLVDKVILEGEFRNLPDEAYDWRGFKGRIFSYEIEEGSDESGNCIFYRKTYPLDGKPAVEMKSRQKHVKECFQSCTTLQEYIDNGLDEAVIEEFFLNVDRSATLKDAQKSILKTIEETYDYEDGTEEWNENPGGFQSIVLSKLPKFLLIPAKDSTDEITGSSGTLQATLRQIFEDIKERSENFQHAQKYLELLANELDPNDQESDVSKMITDVNHVLGGIFPDTGFNANASLSNADSLKPSFAVQMYSNITTSADLQGTGLVRSAVFALLRYKNGRDLRLSQQDSSYFRPLIIGFEEPEIYLHPNAISKMRDMIYELAGSPINQIVCTTHSPYMIDLSKRSGQILNNLYVTKYPINHSGKEFQVEQIQCSCFNVSEAFAKLIEDEKTYIKMLLRADDSIARTFFTSKVLIIEGDTEEIVLKETIKLLPIGQLRSQILSEWQIVRARGKATIIALVNYLRAMDIDLFVMHDKDSDTPGAAKFNEPIQQAVGDSSRIILCEECIEDMLGYPPPSSEKPYTAYKYISDNWNHWNDIPDKWKTAFERIFTNGTTIISKTH